MAGEDVKINVGVGGEQSYTAALKNMNSSLRTLNAELKASQSAFGSQSGSMAGLQDKLSKLGGIYEQQQAKVQLIAQQLEEARGKYDENSTVVQKLRTQLANATTQMNQTAQQINETEGALDELAGAEEGAGSGAEEAGSAIEDEGSSAADSAGKNEQLHQALAKIGQLAGGALVAGLKATGAAMAALGAAAVAGTKAGFDMAKGAGQYADDLLTLSTQTGVSADKLQQWSYASRFVDTSVETMTGSMTKMLKNMNSAANGGKAAQESFDKLGVSITNTDGSLRGSEEVFWDAITALGNISNESERDALAMEIFGKSAKELNPLIEAGAEAWNQYASEAHAMGTVFTEDNLAKMGSFDDSMQRMNATATALKDSIGLNLIPVFQPLVDTAAASMGRVAWALQQGISPEEIPGLVQDLLNTFSSTLQSVEQIVADAMPVISAVISGVVGTLAAELPGILQTLLPAAMELLQTIVSAITDNMDQISALAGTIVSSLAGFLIENLPSLITSAGQLIGGIVDGIIAALPTLIPAGVEAVVQLAGTADTAQIEAFVQR